MKKRKIAYSSWTLIIVFICTAAIMTVYESFKEFLFKGTLTPWQSHSITIIVTSGIATITVSIMRSWLITIYSKEKEIEIKEQSLVSFELILSAVNHIVNNVLNYLQVIKIDMDEYGKVNDETINLFEESLKDADKQMKILNKIKTPYDPESYTDIYPR